MATFPPGPPPGLTVNGYELLTRIGEGGMGVVHLARRPGGTRVALKVLRPHIIGGEEARQRLAREVNSLARIQSRYVAEIVDADPWGDIPYVATRYVPGLSLHDFVREEGPITGPDLDHFARCLAEALAAVHAQGVLHRDIKPSNVLMEGRTPVLIDFGLARVADDPRLTHTGWLLGTPGYLAPEILFGDDASTASDIHSWAATVALAGTGSPPFGRGPAVAVMDRVRRGEYVLDGLPPRLRGIVVACLAPEPTARPSLPDLRDALRLPESPFTAPVRPVEAEDVFTAPLALAALAGATDSTQVEPDHHESHRQEPQGREDQWREPRGRESAWGEEPRREEQWPEDRWAGDSWTDSSPVHEQEWPTVPAQQRHDPTTPYWQDHHGYPPAPAPLPAPHRARRTTLFLALTVVIGALIAAVPYVMSAAAIIGAWLLRSGSIAAEAASARRELRGRPSWTDGPRVLMAAPWHLVRSIPGTLMLVVWGIGVATAVWLFAFALNLTMAQTLLACGTTFAAALGLGPGGRRVRGPLTRVITPLSASPRGFLIGLAVVVAVGTIAAYVALTSGPDWTPGNGRPFEHLGLTDLLRGIPG
ncbi:MAG: serine/threonine-protein kinase [Nocardioides sp.]